MRRAVSLAMIGVGVFALTLAVLLPTVVYNSLAKVPLPQDSTTKLAGRASKALVVNKGEDPTILEDIGVSITARTKANMDAPAMRPGSDYAVWVQAVRVRADTDGEADGKVITANKRQVCFNRRTMQGFDFEKFESKHPNQTPPCYESGTFVVSMVDPANDGKHEYLEKRTHPGKLGQLGVNFKYPFSVEKRDYQVYQPSVHHPVTAEFRGTTEIDGLTVYKFVQEIPTEVIGTKEVGGALLDLDKNNVEANRTYEGTVTQWVEPVSGLIVKQRTVQHQELVAPNNPAATQVVFDGRVNYTADTVAAKMEQAKNIKDKLTLLTTTGPLVLAPVGIILLVAGIVLLVVTGRRERDRDMFDPDTSPRHQAVTF